MNYIKAFVVLFGLGVLGIVANGIDMIVIHEIPGAAQAVIVQFVLVAAGTAVGLVLAPKAGFTSRAVNRVTAGSPLLPGLRSDAGPALAVGAVTGILILMVELLTQLGPEWTVPQLLLAIPQRVLYGGIAEELITRWGLLSLVVFGAWKTIDAGSTRPSSRIIWSAIIIVSVVFGILHLPAVTGDTGTGTATIVVVFNAIPAIGFGWLFWRHSLEAAMLAHAFAHIVFVTARLGILLI